MPIVKVFRLSA